MGEIKKGNLGYRIARTRKDEFGELFHEFDEMAETLQKNSENAVINPEKKNSR